MEKFIPETRLVEVDFNPFTGPAIQRTIPTTESQREVFVASSMGADGNRAYVESVSLQLEGEMDHPAMEKALQDLIARHESLRSAISADGMRMVVFEQTGNAVVFHDLHDLEDTARKQRLIALAHADMEQVFDLVNGPLFRVMLIRTGKRTHLLRLSGHHLVLDGWSLGILMSEISVLYNAHQAGVRAELPPAIPYSDYVFATLEFSRSADHAAVEKYWMDLYQGTIPRADLPTDRNRPSEKTFKGHRLDFQLETGLVQGLRSVATKNGASFVTTLLATFEILVHKLTNAKDIVVGLPTAGQSDFNMKHLVGHCVNLLALRSHVDEEVPFNVYLKERRGQVLDAFDHQKYTFGTLVRKLKIPREAGRIPLVPVIFNTDMNMDDGVSFHGLEHTVISNPRHYENFELFLNATGHGDKLTLEWSYNTDLFDESTIHQWMDDLTLLIKAVISDVSRPIASLGPAKPVQEIRMPLPEWIGSPTDFPREKSVTDLFDEMVAAHGSDIAVVGADEQWTYSTLRERALSIADTLERAGVGPGDFVGLCTDRCPGMVAAMLGTLHCGAAFLPIDHSYPAERIEYMIKDSGIKVLLTQKHVADTLPKHNAQVFLLEEATEALPTKGTSKSTPESAAYMMYTSGSTGNPKGVMVSHRAVVRLVRDQNYLEFGPELTILQICNISFDVSTFEIWGALLNGAKLVLQPQQKPTLQEIVDTIKKHKVDTAWFTSGLFNLMVDEHVEDLHGLKHLLAGGDALSVPHVKRALQVLGPGVLINGYGPTENTSFTTCHAINDDAELQERVPIGRPISNTTVHILDADMQPVPVGEMGELYTGGDGVAIGYWQRPELTASQFIDDPYSKVPGAKLYRSGDMASWRPDGTIEFLGRVDGQVKIRGFRVELGEIESAISTFSEVKDRVVMVRSDVPGEKQLVAYLVPKHTDVAAQETLITTVRTHLREVLPDYMMPAAFVILPELPLTGNGKVDKRALPAPDLDAVVHAAYEAPVGEVEQTIAEIWSKLLGMDHVGRHDNFFELGGHSLLGIQMLAAIRSALNVELTLSTIFEAQTLSDLAEAIHSATRPARTQIAPVDKTGDLEVSFGQQRMWISSQFGRDAYDMSQAIRITGELDVDTLKRSLDALVARHEPLRTTFETTRAGRLIQRIHPPVAGDLTVETVASFDDALARCQQESQRPYDLVAGPVFEPQLYRINDRDHVLLMRMHHIVGDEWSTGVLFRDLSAFYQGDTPTPLRFSYADFAAWQRAHLTADVAARELDYWRTQLSGAPALLELPTDRPRPHELSTNGAQRVYRLPNELWQRLDTVGRQHQATSFMTLLAGFYALLHRYSGATDISIGTPITNRDQPGSEDMIGFFINTLVLRTDLSGTPSFIDLLSRVRSVALGAFSHQDLPFERVVEVLEPERTLAHAPLFQVSFVYQSNEAPPVPPGLTFEELNIASSTAKFDLIIDISPGPDGLDCTLEYNTDLFDAATIDRMLEHFHILLDGIVADPARSINEHSLLTPAEHHRLLAEWNGSSSPFPSDSSIGRIFHEVVDAHTDRIAVEMGDLKISYGALKQRMLVIAGVLERAGVGSGDLVGLCSDRSPDMVAAMLATMWRGAAFVPFDPSYPKERLDHMFKDSGVKVLLAQEHLLDMLPANSATTLLLDDIGDEAPTAAGPQGTAQSPAYIMYTSGSTGQPKGVVVPHRSIVRLVKEQEYLPFGPDLVFLQLSNISFDASTLELWGALLNGAKLVLQPQQKPTLQEIIGTIHQHKVTTVWFTAGVFNLLVDEYLEELRSLKHILTGGDILSVPHVKRALRALGPGVLINGYGPTENTTFTCCYPINDEHAIQARISIGKPINNTTVHILDEAMRPVAIREPGEIYTGGEGVALGYWGKPELTASHFVDDPFSHTPGAKLYRTGDRATWLPDGNIDFLGRADGQVKVRGFRIELGEIENAIGLVPQVKDNVVVVRNDMPGEKQLVAYVVPHALAGANGEGSVPEDLIVTVREHLRNTMPAYMVPTAFMIMDALPLNANGKVDKHALPVPEHRSQTMSAKHVAPRNGTEKRLAKLWEELLNTPAPSVHDNFFDLGGQSIIGIQLLARVEGDFGTRLPLNSLFQSPTIAAFAKLLQSDNGTTGLKNLAILQPAGDRIPFFCVHGDEANHHIMRYLGEDQPYYAFLHQGEDGAPFEHKTVEDIAAHYVSEMVSVQPEGPYLLGGYSFGGIVAYEMASQLRAAGHDVPLLVMFDMYAPEAFNKTTGPEDHFYDPLKNAVMRWLVKRELRKGNIRSPRLRHFHIIDNYLKAILDYHPQPYDGPVTVFKAERSQGPDDMGWSELVTGTLDVRVLPGDHFSLIKDPGVVHLVKELSASIDRAISKHAVEAV